MRKRCLQTGCSTFITKGSYCAEHKPYRGDWHKQSAGILRRDDHVCRCTGCNQCKYQGYQAFGCVRRASTVDHINGDPHDSRPENLKAMCRPCNTVKGGIA